MLYACPTCQRQIDEEAPHCPKCGKPDAGPKARAAYFEAERIRREMERLRKEAEYQESKRKEKAEKDWWEKNGANYLRKEFIDGIKKESKHQRCPIFFHK